MGATVQAFIREKAVSCKYSRVANVVGSLVAASRFTHATLKARATPGVVVSTAPLEEMIALHAQCLGEARQAAKFDLVKPPTAWLDWDACQRARLRAERVVAACDGNDAAEQLAFTRVCCLLVLLTALPPDRVGVYRRLQLGGTLKAVGDGGYQIDLSERGAHKTSAVFGPSRTTVTAAVAARIHSLVTLDALVVGEYLFHTSNDRRSALSPSMWTRFVKTAFRSHSGVALSPKDCRASFITYLRDGNHGNETLRAAAQAMRHSSTMAESASYDKHGSDRLVAAAVQVADECARRYTLAPKF